MRKGETLEVSDIRVPDPIECDRLPEWDGATAAVLTGGVIQSDMLYQGRSRCCANTDLWGPRQQQGSQQADLQIHG